MIKHLLLLLLKLNLQLHWLCCFIKICITAVSSLFKYKSWNSKVWLCLEIFLSCPLIRDYFSCEKGSRFKLITQPPASDACAAAWTAASSLRFALLSFRSARKVNIFWEGHNILQNLQCRFVLCCASQIYDGDFTKMLWPSPNIWTLHASQVGWKNKNCRIW